MRKRIIGLQARPDREEYSWLPIENLALVEVTSEDPTCPIEAAIQGQAPGWRAGTSGLQYIRLRFDHAQTIRRVQLIFRETEERLQEFALSWSTADANPLREIVRQQYQFSPGGSTEEIEEYRVQLDGVLVLELSILPDRSGRPFRASLASFRLSASS